MQRLALLALPLFLAACVSTSTAAPAPASPKPHDPRVTVVFSSSPGGAELWISGELVGSTNVSLPLDPGNWEVEMRKAGFEPYKRTLTVRAGTHTRLHGDLQRTPR